MFLLSLLLLSLLPSLPWLTDRYLLLSLSYSWCTCRYSRIYGQVFSLRPSQTTDITVCNFINLDPAAQIQILEGDIYSANMESRLTGLPVLASLPTGSGRRVFRDTRDFTDIRTGLELRRNELEPLNDVGMHLFADIVISEWVASKLLRGLACGYNETCLSQPHGWPV